MARKPFNAPLDKDGPRINELITAPEVLLIDEKGTKVGIVAVAAAIESAENAGLDLVEVSPNTDPPVCKVLDYGKYKYQKQKKRKEAKKKQKTVEIKEIKIRPNIDVHDYQVKLKAMHRFFEDGDKVKVTLRFRGREMAHQELGMDLLMRLQEEIDEVAKVEMPPKAEGRQIVMVMAPR